MDNPAFRPPRFHSRLFKWICKEDLYSELQGDLLEEFSLNLQALGSRKAKQIYRFEVLKMIRPSIIKRLKKKETQYNNTAMFKNYTKVAFRSLSKNKLFTFINVTGLAIGMSVGLLIVNLIFDAVQFDQFHENKDRLYRVLSTPIRPALSTNETATTPALLAQKMKAELPGLDQVLRIRRGFSGRIKLDKGSLFTQGIYADDNFFEVFSFDLKQGNPQTALTNPFSLILTETLAKTLKPEEDLMGQVLTIPDRGEFLVTGIVADPPAHSHFQFQMITGFSTVKPLEQQQLIWNGSENWEDFNTSYVYFLLAERQNIKNIQSWLDNAAVEIFSQFENTSNTFSTQKVTSIVPGKDLNNQIGAELVPLPIIILGAVAMAIVLSACFNYTNLSIARALRRSKEIGVRKIVGSTRKQIFYQFTIETVIVTLIAVFFAYFIFLVIKPLFLASIPRIDQIMQPENPSILMLFFVLFAVFIGLVAGLFPALFFSKIKPLTALRSNSSIKLFSHVNVRKALIVVQFTLSMFFLITMNVISKQYKFSMAHDMGFKENNILNLSLNGNDPEKLWNELEKIPEIQSISASSTIVGTPASQRTIVKNVVTNDSVFNDFLAVSPEYFALHDINVISGDIYEPRQTNEALNQVMVNEKFVAFQGYDSPDAILGEQFIVSGHRVTVAGVVEDFNYLYIEEPIRSLVMFESLEKYDFLNLNLETALFQATIDKIEKAWRVVDEETELEVKFLDQELEETNAFLIIFVRVFGFLGLIAASIACLGLLGMAVFTAETRIKEIGIRKTVGASIGNLIMILSKSYIKIVAISGIIGGFIAYLVLQKLILAQIHYHVSVGIFEILSATLILLSLAILAVGSQIWKAAKRNPVESLRYE